MPLRIVTACMALFGSLGVPSELLQSPTTKDKLTVLVYGGATSTGTAAIQLLSRCGVNVITTCSAGSMAMVESYGADKCFDYNEASCGEDIRSFTGNALDYALDCITTESSVKICYRALGRCGGKCKSSIWTTLSTSQWPLIRLIHRRRSRAAPRRGKLTQSRLIGLDSRRLAQWSESELAGAVWHRRQARVRRLCRSVLPADTRALHARLVQVPPSQRGGWRFRRSPGGRQTAQTGQDQGPETHLPDC